MADTPTPSQSTEQIKCESILIHASDTERIFHKYVLLFFSLSPNLLTIFFGGSFENQADSSDFAEDAN